MLIHTYRNALSEVPLNRTASKDQRKLVARKRVVATLAQMVYPFFPGPEAAGLQDVVEALKPLAFE
jgi:hypothetical protein